MNWYTISDTNPEPWTAPSLGTKRVGRKVVPVTFKNAALAAYQASVRDSMAEKYPDLVPVEHDISLWFFLWRQLPVYEGEKGRVRKHVADTTNMQKALEDALQTVLYKNDRQVRSIHTVVAAQEADTNPFIAILMLPWEGHEVVLTEQIEMERRRSAMQERVVSEVRNVDVESVF